MANRIALEPIGVTSDALKSITWTEQDSKEEGANNDAKFLSSTVHAKLVYFWEGSLDFEFWASGTLPLVLKKGDLSDLNKWQP
eukprot:10045496-Ditylum_brightwellii.AAC.1